jgi:hypothetical protein
MVKCKHPVGKIILVVWLIFSILYVGLSQYQYWRNVVARNAYERGLQDAVVEVMRQAQECNAFPVTLGDQGVQLVNIACLQQPEEESNDQ